MTDEAKPVGDAKPDGEANPDGESKPDDPAGGSGISAPFIRRPVATSLLGAAVFVVLQDYISSMPSTASINSMIFSTHLASPFKPPRAEP